MVETQESWPSRSVFVVVLLWDFCLFFILRQNLLSSVVDNNLELLILLSCKLESRASTLAQKWFMVLRFNVFQPFLCHPADSVNIRKKHSDFLTSGLFKCDTDMYEDQEMHVIFLSLLPPAYVCVSNYCNLSGHLIHYNGRPLAMLSNKPIPKTWHSI